MTSIVCSPSSSFYTSAYMDRSFSRDSNSAGAPLPRIPRRSPPLRSQFPVPSTTTTLQKLFASPPPAKLVVQPPTPPSKTSSPLSKAAFRGDDAASGSGSGSESYVEMIGSKSRRTRKRLDVCPPEQSTPTPAVLEAKLRQERGVKFPSRGSESPSPDDEDTPRASAAPKPDVSRLRLNLDETNRASASVEPTPALTATSSTASSASVGSYSRSVSLGRKKSGEPLKSSLKSRRPIVRGDLSVITGALSSKSEPSTPTHIKSVHFDAQLEHVKLFLAQQKPLAVSRDGSPTDDTSGTDSDFPSFIFGHSDDDRIRKSLTLDVINIPRVPADADVALESLVLSADGYCVVGSIQVRNLAFEKWVAVRFTFDWWQTTSEVTAKYVSSLPGGTADRFTFSIRLNDMLKRIEEKTLFLAVRYSVTGREIWDNNGGSNYQVKFKVQPTKSIATPAPKMQTSMSAPSPSPSLERIGSPNRMADLKIKLEQVARGREDQENTVGGVLAQEAKRSPPGELPEDGDDSFTLKSGTPLSSRYDFSASLRSPWKAGSPFASVERPRTSTYPNAMPWFPQRQAFQEKKSFSDPNVLTRGSPRIADDDDSAPSPHFFVGDLPDMDATPVPVLSRRRSRNHARGYLDLGILPSNSVRRTPPGTPRGESSLRFNSFPPADGQSYISSPPPNPESLFPWLKIGGSEESTPSITDSNASSSSQDSSPVESPITGPSFWSGSPTTSNYNVFLSKFCFFTGGSESMLDVPAELQRSHSASSVEELLSSPTSANSHSVSPMHTPTRSSSFDDVGTATGGSTPTTCDSIFGSPATAHATPVAFVH